MHLFFSFCHSTFNCCRKLFALLSRLGFVWFQCGSDFALHCTFCCVGHRDLFTLHVIFHVKSPTRSSYVSTYAKVTIHCIFANILHNYFSQNVLIAQVAHIARVAQVAASSVASRGLHVCTCVKRRRRIQVHICPPSVQTNTNTAHIYVDTAKKHKVRNTWMPHRRMSMSYIS